MTNHKDVDVREEVYAIHAGMRANLFITWVGPVVERVLERYAGSEPIEEYGRR